MRRLISCLILLAVVVTPFAASAQDDEAPKRRVDAAAKKLLDTAIGQIYSPIGSGLKTMACKTAVSHPQMPMAVNWTVKFEAPKTLSVSADLPAEMEAYRPQFDKQFKQLVEGLVARPCMGAVADADEFHIEAKEGAENTIVMTGFSADKQGETRTVTFGKDGLPAKVVVSEGGVERTLTPKYEKKDDKFVEVSNTIELQGMSIVIKITPEKLGGFWLTTKAVVSVPTGDLTLTVSGHQVNGKAATKAPAEKKGCGKDCGGEGGCEGCGEKDGEKDGEAGGSGKDG